MNWLAHIFLSKKNVEFQLGNFLADPLKGKLWDGASQSLVDGINMHKAIDSFADSHHLIVRSMSRLSQRGHLKGVVIDLLYDHFLSLAWESYAAVSRQEFLNIFYVEAKQASIHFPSNPKRAIKTLIEADWLNQYHTFEGFVTTLERIDNRLSPRIKARDATINYRTAVEREYENLKSDFDLFFPELILFFKNHELGSQSDHNFVVF